MTLDQPAARLGRYRWDPHPEPKAHARDAGSGHNRMSVHQDASANPPIISPIAAIQLPQARIAMPRHAVDGPASGRRKASVKAMVSVIAA